MKKKGCFDKKKEEEIEKLVKHIVFKCFTHETTDEFKDRIELLPRFKYEDNTFAKDNVEPKKICGLCTWRKL